MTFSITYVTIAIEVIALQVTYGRGYVYIIQYHIVWCVKYRHKALTPKIEKRLYEILSKIAKDNSFQILECNSD